MEGTLYLPFFLFVGRGHYALYSQSKTPGAPVSLRFPKSAKTMDHIPSRTPWRWVLTISRQFGSDLLENLPRNVGQFYGAWVALCGSLSWRTATNLLCPCVAACMFVVFMIMHTNSCKSGVVHCAVCV